MNNTMIHIIVEFDDGTSTDLTVDKPYGELYLEDVTVALRRLGHKNKTLIYFYKDVTYHE